MGKDLLEEKVRPSMSISIYLVCVVTHFITKAKGIQP